jgi:hypothetical protein
VPASGHVLVVLVFGKRQRPVYAARVGGPERVTTVNIPVFIAHYGVGLAAKKLTPYTSLGTLMVAAQWLDLVWPSLLQAGIERVRIDPGNTRVTPLAFEYYPWSHSLLMAIAWAALVAGGYALLRRSPCGAWVMFPCVISHWVLDFITHRPDLPLYPPDGPLVGLGLWNARTPTLMVEFAAFLAGVWIYARNTEPTDSAGRYALAAFAVSLPAIYMGNVFGPPPPSTDALAWLAQGQWLLVAWAIWIDRHRVAIRQWR